jgi:hypothetical protein
MVDDSAGAAAQDAGKVKRFRSEIEFPYSDLESAISLAKTVHQQAGTSCTDAELAAWMNKTADGGTFRAWLSAARMFGLVEFAQGRVTLTMLGRDILDDAKTRAAKAEAFLKPELFAALYTKFMGAILPPAAAIARQIEELGVSPKQKERARQTFMKSAHHAGFIDTSTGRLIKPGNVSDVPKDVEKEPKSGGGGDDGGTSEIDPIIRGLLARLPKSGDVWPEAERKLWLQLLEGSFRLIYKDKRELSSPAQANLRTLSGNKDEAAN